MQYDSAEKQGIGRAKVEKSGGSVPACAGSSRKQLTPCRTLFSYLSGRNTPMMTFEDALRLMFIRLNGWFKLAISHLPDLLLAVGVVIVFNLLARYLRRLMVKSLDHLSDNPALVNLTGTFIQLTISSVGLFYALGLIGLDKTVTSLLAGAGVLALAIGFALQDLTANFISGTIIALQRPIQVHDVVETNGYTGRVISVKLRSVVLDNFSGQTIEIPSKDVFQKPIVNYTRSGQRRIELSAGISYADDLDKAQRVAIEAIGKLPFLRAGKPVEMNYRGFTLDMVQFFVWFWIDPTKADPATATSEALKALKKAFDKHSILIVFAPYTLDLKQRLKQERLSEIKQSADNAPVNGVPPAAS